MPERDLSHISLDLLKTLVAFAELGRVEDAARSRGLTQAAVSLQLRRLEQDVGQPLFQVLGRRKVLTDFARDLCQLIAPPLRDLDRTLAEVLRFSPNPASQWTIAGPAVLLETASVRFSRWTGRRILRAMGFVEVASALRDDRVDVGLLPQGLLSGGDWAEVPFVDIGFRFESHQRPARAPSKTEEWKSLLKKSLKDELVLHHGFEPDLDRLCVTLGVENQAVRKGDVVEDRGLISAVVAQAKGWALVPAPLEQGEEWLLPTHLIPSSKMVMVYRRDRQRLASMVSES